jgi:hypothetical protein
MAHARRPSDEVKQLLRERAEARAARDFGRADLIRERVERRGWAVCDVGETVELEDLLLRVERHSSPGEVQAADQVADRCDYSICIALYGWPEDVVRMVTGLGWGEAQGTWELIAVAAREVDLEPADLLPPELRQQGAMVRLLDFSQPPGHAGAWNIAARVSRGHTLVFVDPSLEFPAELLARLDRELDAGAGLVGPLALRREGQFKFVETEGPAIDALEYLLAMRRSVFCRVGDFDQRFRFYRNLDIDYSYQARAAGLPLQRVACPGVIRHTHRLWESTPETERERLSRKNFNRFLDRWIRPGR